MSRFIEGKWKYLSITLSALLAGVILAPQANAANPDHNDIIAAITNAVTTIQNAISSSASATQTNVGTVHAVSLNDISIDPFDTSSHQVDILDERTGPSHSGHISFRIDGPLGTADTENKFILACLVSDSFVQIEYTEAGSYDQDFSCLQLSILVLDNPVGTNAGPVTVNALVQYTRASDLTTINQGDLP